MPANNVQVVGHWTKNSYTVTYVTDGTAPGDWSDPASENYGYGEGVTLPAVTVPTGYSFSGWDASDLNGDGAAGYTMPANNVQVVGHWTKNNTADSGIIVTFDPQGGVVAPTNKVVTYNKPYGNLPTPTRTGYAFDGWYTAASGGTKVDASTLVQNAGNHTLYAHWTASQQIIQLRHNYTLDGAYQGTVDDGTISGVPFGTPYGFAGLAKADYNGRTYSLVNIVITYSKSTPVVSAGVEDESAEAAANELPAVIPETQTVDDEDTEAVAEAVNEETAGAEADLTVDLTEEDPADGVQEESAAAEEEVNAEADSEESGSFLSGILENIKTTLARIFKPGYVFAAAVEGPTANSGSFTLQPGDQFKFATGYNYTVQMNYAATTPPVVTPVIDPPAGGGGAATVVTPQTTTPAPAQAQTQTPPTTTVVTPVPAPTAAPAPTGTEGEGEASIEDPEVPLSNGGAAWALLNLLLTILAIVLTAALWITYRLRRKEEDQDDPNIEVTVKRRVGFRIVSIIVAVVAVIVFILTEDMTLPMQITDKWTIWMVVIAVAQILVAFFSRKKVEEEDLDQQHA
jgi:uncharacterized repeat protein (TIGR02543 family)